MAFTTFFILNLIILFIALIIFLFYLYMTRNFNYWKVRGVSAIKPVPFVGNFGECLLMKKSIGQWARETYEFGSSSRLPYVGFYLFGKPGLMIRDPDLIKNILTKDFNCFKDRYATTSPHDMIGSANLFLVKNPAWKIVRQKLNPIYTPGKLRKMFKLMVEIGHDLIDHMENLKLEGSGRTIDVSETCAKFTTDLITTTAFGVRSNCLNNPNSEFRDAGRKTFKASLWRNFELLSIFFIPELVQLLGIRFLPKEAEVLMRDAITDVMKHRQNLGIARNDLIDLLVDLKKNNQVNKNQIFDFDGDNLVAQAAIFFIGGFETSSTTMSWTLYELALNPEIQSRLREEINNALNKHGGQLDYDTIMELQYLDMCISEILRKYSPLPMLVRNTTENYKLPNSDFVVEKNTPVFIPISGLHADPEYFPNPEKYDPERFSNENRKNINQFAYLPFGAGPHRCIAIRIGLLQVKLGLIKLLSEYEFSPSKETTIPLRLSTKAIITTAKDGIYLNIRKIIS